MKLFIPVFFVMLIMTSCEEDITVDLPVPEPRLVIEGYINPGGSAYVFISKSVAYFAPVDSAALVSSAVKNAIVTVSDGTITDTLIEPAPDIGYFYISPNLHGEVGKTYSLKVVTETGETATAVTTIHPPVPLDSIWFLPQNENDTLGWIWARLTDPAGVQNNYRWFAKRLVRMMIL
jgi:hypothetical protein